MSLMCRSAKFPGYPADTPFGSEKSLPAQFMVTEIWSHHTHGLLGRPRGPWRLGRHRKPSRPPRPPAAKQESQARCRGRFGPVVPRGRLP